MTEAKKRHYVGKRGKNLSYINWVYEACSTKNIENVWLQIDRNADFEEIKDIIAKYLAGYEGYLFEANSYRYKKSSFINGIDYYIEEKDERCCIKCGLYLRGVKITGTADLAARVIEDLKELLPMRGKRNTVKNHISIIVPDPGEGYAVQPYPIKRKEFTNLNYPPRVRKAYRQTIKNFKSEDPPGRLLLLKGPPGTGKTYFIRALISDVKGNKIFVPSHMAASLSGPGLLKVLIDTRSKKNDKQILIFEDAENLLLKRQIDNSSFVSTVLNFADGFLAELTNTYIVASTNIDEDINIDSAILRPGRLMEKIDFPRLDADHANRLYKSIAGSDGNFNSPAVLAEVYHKARGGADAEDELKARAGFMAAG